MKTTLLTALLVAALAVPLPSKAESTGIFDTLQVDGRYLLDTCGNPLVIRGVEQGLGWGFEFGGTFENLIEQLYWTGANAVRLLPDISEGQLEVPRIAELIGTAVGYGLVVYLSPMGDIDFSEYMAFFERADVQEMVARFSKWMIVDAVPEPPVDEREEWRDLVVDTIQHYRELGYTVPFVAIAPVGGRDLPAALQYGSEIEAADPLGKTILGWQAYWGSSDWYQYAFGGQQGLDNPTSVTNGIEVAAQQSFPIQAGFLYHTDPNEIMDYEAAMTAAAEQGIGWLWWSYYLPFEAPVWRSALSRDGSLGNLYQPYGPVVTQTHPDSLPTAQPACGL